MKEFSRRAAKTQREEKVNHEERLGEDNSPYRVRGFQARVECFMTLGVSRVLGTPVALECCCG